MFKKCQTGSDKSFFGQYLCLDQTIICFVTLTRVNIYFFANNKTILSFFRNRIVYFPFKITQITHNENTSLEDVFEWKNSRISNNLKSNNLMKYEIAANLCFDINQSRFIEIDTIHGRFRSILVFDMGISHEPFTWALTPPAKAKMAMCEKEKKSLNSFLEAEILILWFIQWNSVSLGYLELSSA